MKRNLVACIALASAFAASPARAHPMEFGVMSVEEQRAGLYDFELRFSGGEDAPSAAAPWFGSGCSIVEALQIPLDWGIHVRGTVRCPRGLAHQRVGVAGLEGTDIEVPLTLRFRNGDVQSTVLDGDSPRYLVRARATKLAVLSSYLKLGVEHIALGFDHLLLVLGLVLASKRIRDVAITVTSFTLGHSLTLALASLGVIHVPGPPVEACIALSLVLLAIELVRARERPEGAIRARPWFLAVVFGLLHGLGFAGALAEVGVPRSAIGVALLGFNLGVEAGQLAFVAFVVLAGALARRTVPERPMTLATRALPEMVGALATFFLLDRLLSLGS